MESYLLDAPNLSEFSVCTLDARPASYSICLFSVRSMIDQFLTLYTAATPKWDNIGDLAGRLGWTDMASNSTLDYLLKQGVSEKYIKEVVEAATRVNYGQVRILKGNVYSRMIKPRLSGYRSYSRPRRCLLDGCDRGNGYQRWKLPHL